MKQTDDFQPWMEEEEMSDGDVKSIAVTFITFTGFVMLAIVALVLV